MMAAAGAEYLGHGCEWCDWKLLEGQEVVTQWREKRLPSALLLQIPTKELTEILLGSAGVCINIRYLQVIVFSFL